MKKSRILAMTTAGVLAVGCLAFGGPALSGGLTETAEAASNTTVITKYLKQFKKQNFKKAYKTLKKLKASNKDTSLKKMTKKQKKAYKKIVKKYIKQVPALSDQPGTLDGYYLVDLNKDKVPELLLKYGADESEKTTDIYTLKNNKASKAGTISSGHSVYMAYPGKGVLVLWGHMGECTVSAISMKNGKLVRKEYGSQEVKIGQEYCLPSEDNLLYGHVITSNDGSNSYDLKDLK